ncbi:bifunctional glutamate N-acetyltransferase/amino-acid acetyltransferase ArgJ [Desulfobacula sp.]|uniref:bifunctional glutamate N-acetyltransferase/amino-acid acetyltransferase ArgJ n=1 Tax=Desulfobacula sp. TaxID=2593537 RepID=UPI0025C25684|nr:bifunctional glutamate N-acetyltransferase/amino-acid acetyltransferase ArgJ [Desulfobacula sp.]MBC2704349.1 bifunctional glutamate N-acetyltransferase/amino-acid acetyltransferase ArgJ [Desulfobacula sp.]
MKGFKFAGIEAGIKKNGRKDLGLIYCETPAVAAALFTRNKVVAAPLVLGKEKIKKGLCQAVLVNSGNANCFTGDKGIEDAIACSKMVADSLGISEDLVLVSSTGVIGANLPMDKFETGIPDIVTHLSADYVEDFATAILTTDKNSKIVKKSGTIGDKKFSIMGIAKGSGMIRPDMATMLAFICTDVKILDQALKTSLSAANEKSFNRITVDGDTSTNDTLLALASGTSGVEITNVGPKKIFQTLLDNVCLELAKMVVKDGEGATKLIQIIVKGAQSKQDAFKASETIAHSNLVKTAVYGEDPNWGRIIAAAGRSGAHVVPEKMDLFFDDQPLVLKGKWLGVEPEKKTAQIMKKKEITITLDLNLGKETDSFLFCDFSEDYVKINAEYRS